MASPEAFQLIGLLGLGLLSFLTDAFNARKAHPTVGVVCSDLACWRHFLLEVTWDHYAC